MVGEHCTGENLSGQCRMYTNFTNLNKACLKDVYPLPKINQLVDDEALGYTMLSLLNTYSDYNHIPMFHPNKDKTGFITESAKYFYKIMLFELKNTRATYR